MKKQNDIFTSSFEEFCNLVKTAYENGEHFILIWKNEEERAKCGGNERKMNVAGVWVQEGIASDGKPYGQDVCMELPDAMDTVLKYTRIFRLLAENDNGLVAMGFEIEGLLANEGRMMFAHRGFFCNHLKGPIVSIPSCKVIG